MKKTAFPVLLLSLLLACCGDDKSPNNAPEDDEEVSSSSLADSKSKKSSSSKKNSSSSYSSSSTKNSSSSKTYSTEFKIDPKTVTKGKFTDKRDGRVYKTVTIGDQTWMAENLNYKTSSDSECEADSTDKKCEKKGLLYKWQAIIDAASGYCEPYRICAEPIQGICPDGWRIPTRDEWDTLITRIGIRDKDGIKIEAGYRLRSKDFYGSDVYGFSALTVEFWTSTNFRDQRDDRRVVTAKLGEDAYLSGSAQDYPKAYLRCIQDTTPKPDLNNPATIRSYDKNCKDSVWTPKIPPCNINGKDNCEYGEFEGKKTIKIGNQKWMNYDKTVYPLYDSRTCPLGWRVPDPEDWDELIQNVGGKCFATKMLASQKGWESGNGFNAYGFDIKPTGYYSTWFDYEKKRVSQGREFYEKETATTFVVRDSLNTTYKYMAYFSTGKSFFLQYNADYSANLYCVSSTPAPDISSSFFNPNFNYGEFTDSRDGKTYKTTIIGPQKWMAQNLNYESDSSVCYQDYFYSSYCKSLGRLYSFEDAQNACPAGYHLPSKAEFDTLMYFGAIYRNTKNLFSAYNFGDDTYGFSLVMAGSGEGSTFFSGFYDKKQAKKLSYSGAAFLWSSTPKSDSTAYGLYAYKSDVSDTLHVGYSKTSGLWRTYASVRCVNDTAITYSYAGKYGTLMDDRDNQEYKTVEINGVTWMAENLRYRPNDEARCYTYMDSIAKYGCYYQAPFETDSTEPVCPAGWHVSTETDWDNLIKFVGDSAATKLRSVYGWEHIRWTGLYTTVAKGKDQYGLNIIPSGCFKDPSQLSSFKNELNKLSKDYSPRVCIAMEVPNDSNYHYIQAFVDANQTTNATDFTKNIETSRNRLYSIRCVKD